MSKGDGPWREGRRAWERLSDRHQDAPSAPAAEAADGDDALDALSDVGEVRRLLDQAELVAVRSARRHGKSWTEIAIRLGVTRQSAWERWRDLDEAAPARVTAERDAPAERDARAGLDVPAEVLERAGRERRRASVVVPNVVAQSFDDARSALLAKGLLAVGPDPDGPPLTALDWPDGVVTDQSPEAGARVPPGSRVTLWIERGGGSGVREPRKPVPAPRQGRAMREESVG